MRTGGSSGGRRVLRLAESAAIDPEGGSRDDLRPTAGPDLRRTGVVSLYLDASAILPFLIVEPSSEVVLRFLVEADAPAGSGDAAG